MALRYLRQDRRLMLRGSILLTDGTTHALSADNVVRYHIDETSTGGEAITIGDTRAAEYTLVIEDTAHSLTAAQLLGAKVTMEIGIDGTFDPLGVWTVSRTRISRQSATIDISGADALGDKADSLYAEGAYPATLGEILQRAADQAGLTLKSAVFRNSGVSVATAPEWDRETTSVRAVIGYVAGCAGGFARIDRAGLLEIVPYGTQTAGEVSADYFATLNVGMGRSFAFNCLQIMHYNTNIYTRYAVDSNSEDTAGNTLRISDNPLMTADIARALVEALTGLSGQAISADWVGDPTVQTGELLTFVDTDGARYPGIVTGQTIEIDGGLHMTTDADLPESISAAYATDTLYTPAGKVNITAIEGRLKVWAENEIDLAVGNVQIGGTNLVRETGWYAQVAPTSAGWHKTGGGWYERPLDADVNRDDYPENGYAYWNGTAVNDLWTPYVNVQVGEAYTVSFRHRGAGLRVIWFGLDANSEQVWGAENTFGHGVTTDAHVTKTIPANVARFRVVFRTTSGQSGVLGCIKMERGNKATAWSPSPLDYSRGVQHGSNLLITDKVVRINTPELEINVSGEDGDGHFGANGLSVDKVNSPSVRKRYDGPTTLTIGGTADGVSSFATLGDAFAKLSGCFLPEPVAINITISALTENRAVLCNAIGASVTVNGGGCTITGQIYLDCLQSRVALNNATIQNGGGDAVVTNDCEYVRASGCTLITSRASNTYHKGIACERSKLDISGCSFRNCYEAIEVHHNSTACILECTGNNNAYAVVARYNSRVGMIGSRPDASSGISADASCSISADPGAGTSGSSSAPAATTTVTLTATNTRTHAGSWYSGTNVLSQGVSGGTSFYGYMWFDLSSIYRKTIKSASIRLYRRAGVGRGVPVEVYVGTHNATGPSGGLSMVNAYSDHLVGKVDQKETLSASVATAAVQALASGTAKGLFVHSGSSGYAQFDGYDGSVPPQLTVTYQ